MAKALVIVESPAKAKTINKYLGNQYVVKASLGPDGLLTSMSTRTKSWLGPGYGLSVALLRINVHLPGLGIVNRV